jgi:hypothetical protein
LIEGAHVLRPSGFVYVTAVLPDNTATAASGKFHYETTPLNKQDRIEPLPLTGISVPATAPRLPAGQAGSKPPARGNTKTPLPGASSLEPGASPPPPTGIHVDVRTPNSIRLSWRPVSREVRYNVYSSGSSQLTNLRQENEAPLKSNAVEWIPETGLDRYWIVVTTLAPDGRESAYSEAVEVIRYPEKSGRSAADEAAGVLRKVLPW